MAVNMPQPQQFPPSKAYDEEQGEGSEEEPEQVAQAAPLQTLYNSGVISKDVAMEVRMGFVRKVYSILAIQLLVTFAIAMPIALSDPKVLRHLHYVNFASLGVYLLCFCTMVCCSDLLRRYPWNYTFLGIFTLSLGVMLGFYGALFTWQSLLLAGVLTTFIFGGLTVFAWTTMKDFTGMGPYLLVGLLTLIAFGFTIPLLSWGFGFSIEGMTVLYDMAGVMLFCGYIVYDTQKMIGEHGGHKHEFSIDDYCFAALNLYLDVINLFIHLLQLFGQRR